MPMRSTPAALPQQRATIAGLLLHSGYGAIYHERGAARTKGGPTMSTKTSTTFGKLLRQHRLAAGLSQEELAEKAGLSPHGISDLERGARRAPWPNTVRLLAEALKLTEGEGATFLAAALGNQVAQTTAAALPTQAAGGPAIATEEVVSAAGPPPLPGGTVTFLFTDIEGSTRLLQRLGAKYGEVLNGQRAILRAALVAHGGSEVDAQGDSLFAVFPTAHAALAAAATAQRELAVHAWPEGTEVRMRIGLHSGAPTLAGDRYVGLDVHRAARIGAAGHGGQVLLSAAVMELARDELPEGAAVHDLGVHRLKDLQRPERLFQLVLPNLPNDFPPLKTLDARPNNLPIQSTSLVGREKDLADVVALLHREDVRLLTLTGAGGTGKTRLAVQVAAELSDAFADGVWFVRLSRLVDPALVIPTIAQTLGLHEAGRRPIGETLVEYLREKQTLLVLDNFEQVVTAATEVAALLETCAGLKMLVTSRVRLRLRGEKEYRVKPLLLPDPAHLPPPEQLSQYAAVALFVQRAQDAVPDFAVTNATAPAIAAICARLDGLPLAIELAAAKVRVLPLPALLARLERQLPVLVGGARDLEARQQTMRNTLAWSYSLLSAEEQRLLRRLAVFVGGATLEAVEAVCVVPDGVKPLGLDALEGLTALVEQSLVQQWESGTEGEASEARFGMLHVVREYALERLAASAECDVVRQAHASWYLKLAEEAAPALKGPQLASWVERLGHEYDNLRATLKRVLEQVLAGGSIELAMRLGEELMDFWDMRGLNREGLAFLESVVAASAGAAPALRARALLDAADFASGLGDLERGEVLLQESLALYRTVGDRLGIASCLSMLGFIAQTTGSHYGAHHTHLEDRLALARELGDRQEIARALALLADSIGFLGEFSRARLLFGEGLALYRELGNKRGIAWCLRQSAMWLFIEYEPRDRPTAHARLDECLMLCQESDDREGLAFYCWIAGWVALDEGDLVTARSLLAQSLALWREIGLRWRAVWAATILGRVATKQGDFAVARDLQEESLREARTFEDLLLTAFCLEGLAHTVAAEGADAWAARLWGAAESLRERSRVPRFAAERVDYEAGIRAVRSHLGEEAFASAWAEGRTMTLAQVLASPS
jgi:predicted ATPase/class 3 adenylate cyclase